MNIEDLPFKINDRYYHYSSYLKNRFGKRVGRICVDAGFTCPTRDGKLGFGGCLYCDNTSFAPVRRENLIPVDEQVREFLSKHSQPDTLYLVYFQPYTNTYAPVEMLRKIYSSVLSIPRVVGIIIGTRPDCLEEPVLSLLEELNGEIYVSVEVGIESVYDKNLIWAQRGHTFSASRKAVLELAKRGIHAAAHLILGFPLETREEILKSAEIINDLPLNAIKIHHLHVVKGSRLAEQYLNSPFPLFTEEEWILLVCDFLERLRPDIVIQRLMGEAQGDTLIAPIWSKSKGAILNAIKSELARRNSYQGKYWLRSS